MHDVCLNALLELLRELNVVIATLRELVYTRYIRSNISAILFSAEHMQDAYLLL